MIQRAHFELETWLRAPWRRALLVLLVVLVATFATTAQFGDVFGESELAPASGRLFLVQLTYWATWAVAGIPIAAVGAWLYARLGSGLAFLTAEILLSLGVAWLFQGYATDVAEWILPDRGPGFESRWGRGERGERTGRESWSAQAGSESPGSESPGTETPGPELLEPPPEPQVRPWDGFGERFGEGDSDRWGRGRREERRRGMRSAWYALAFQREVLVYWVVLALGLGSRAYVTARARDRQQAALDLEAERLRTELARAEVQSLERQLNPHFLFNTLHSVGGLIRSEEKARALAVLSSLGDLLRTTLARGEFQETTLEDEVRIALGYLDIERIRFGERLAVTVEIEDAALDVRVPSLILLPLVENAVRYGVEPRPEGGSVKLVARVRAGRLEVDVEDDGPGFPAHVLAAMRDLPPAASSSTPGGTGGNGIGLANGRRRLAMLYGPGARLVPENRSPRGARVRLVLPLERPAQRPSGSSDPRDEEPWR